MSFSIEFTPSMLFEFLKTIKDKNIKDLTDKEKDSLLLYKEYYNKNTVIIQEELNKNIKQN